MTTIAREDRDERREKIANFVYGGKSVDEAAERFGVSPNTVRSVCKERAIRPAHLRRERKRARDARS